VSKQASGNTPAGSTDTADNKVPSAQIFKGSGVLLKPSAPDKPSAEPADVSLNFEAADIRDIAKTVLAEILKESYIVDPRVQGSISFRTTQPLPRSAVLPTLETVLRMNGIVLVKENGIYKIIPAAAVRGSLSPKTGGVFAGFTVQIVPLKFLGVREMAKILEPFAPDASAIKIDEVRNLLILAGTHNEIGHMLDAVDMFDVDWLSGMSVGVFTLRSTDVKTVDAELRKILGDANANPLAGMVRFIPIERLNAFIVITPQPHYLEQAKLWLERLDRASGTGGTRLFVYYVQNGKADHLAQLLNQTFGGGRAPATRPVTAPSIAPGLTPSTISSASPPGSPPGTAPTQMAAASAPVSGATLSVTDDSGSAASEVRVVADMQNNALLILANSAGYEKIEAALKKLDTAPRQVLIEVTIAEVTLKDELQYGLEWLFTNGARRSGQLDTGAAGLNQIVPGFSYAITSSTGSTINAVLNMLASNNKLNVLSSPHIMVSDNQTAKIQVGDSVPTAGPQSLGAAGVVVSSVQYLDTGVILSVTPHINAGGLVNMDINQEVSNASSTTTSGLNSPTISKRSAKTVVTVQSGETTVLGGLISENVSAGSSGLPFLSSIPILGGLFGTQSRNSTKTELVVLITPRVANNVGQAKLVSDEFRKRLREAEELLDCGTSNALGYTTRRGLWCQHPPFFGAEQIQKQPGQ
jgi:general secretion pathway protein D